MSLDNQGLPPGEHAEATSAGTAQGNEAAPGSVAEPTTPARKTGRTKNAAKKTATALELPNGCTLSAEVDIPVADLVITQRRDEGDEGRTRLQNLGKSMRFLGQLYPLIVRIDQVAGKYPVLAGNRRAAAALLEGILTLRCRVFAGPDQALPHVIAAVENGHREQESPWGLAQKLHAAVREGFDQQQLAEMFQKSKGAVSDLLYAATKLPAAYRKRVEKGESLFKVVAEHRKVRKSTEAVGNVAATKAEPRANPDPQAAAEHQYGRYEHGRLTVIVVGAAEERPPGDDLIAALRHAIGVCEAMPAREPPGP